MEQNKNMFDEGWKVDELKELYEQIVNVEYQNGDLHFSLSNHKLTDEFRMKALKLFTKLHRLDLNEILDTLYDREQEKT